ncbi:MAG: hypothetical protein H6705_20645 [Myxococcales bacterium]|nr:hypothetical protein [Myxococcales bacterium]
MCPAPWDTVSTGFDWDLEIAVRDHFFDPGPTIGPVQTPGEPAPQPRSRGDMVSQALGGGALTGLVEGGKSIVIDTAINVASSKIPYVAGFVEAGRMFYTIYDKGLGGWAAEVGSGLTGGGKFGEGWAKLTSGDPIDTIEGVLDMADGVKTILDTLTSICWAVAGIGFLLSFIPGMQWLIPFVALAAKWGSILGAVGTVMGTVTSILRAVMIGLRTVDILYLESDPAAAEQKAARLQEDTGKFVQAWTERAGDSVRNNLSGGPHPSQRKGGDGDGAPRTGGDGGGGAPRPTVLQRAGNVLTSFASASIGAGQLSADNRGRLANNIRNTAGATVGAFKPGQTTGERIHGLESRGVDVYVNDRHRDFVNDRLGPDAADPSTRQGARGQAQAEAAAAQQKYDEASAELDAARRDQSDARQTLAEAQQRLEAAQERLRQVEGGTAAQRQAAETELAERKALLDSYGKDVQTTADALAAARQQLQTARADRLRSYYGDPVANAAVARAEQQVKSLERELTSARQGQAEAQVLYVEGQAELNRANAPVNAAQGEVERASGRRDTAQHYTDEAGGVVTGLEPGARAAGDTRDAAASRVDGIDARTAKARESFDARMALIAEHQRFRDLSGSGADGGHLYGHNKGSGVTGFLTGDAVGLLNRGLAALSAEEEPTAEAPAGEAPTPTPEPAPTPGPAPTPEGMPGPAAAPGPDYGALIREAVQNLAVGLPAPPTAVPGAVDGAAGAVELINAEEEALRAQQTQIGEARAAGETSLGEIAEGRAMVEAGRGGVGGIEGEADTLEGKQDELGAAAQQAGAEAAGGQSKSGEGQGLIEGFVGKFLELMGKVPSRFVSNAGAGSEGAQQLQGAATGGAEAMQTGASAGAAAEAAATEHKARTTALRGQTEATAGQLDTAEGAMNTREQDAQTGLGELDQAEAELEAELAALCAERDRLVAGHAADAQLGADWTQAHQSERLAREADLEALISEAEAATGGR